MKPRTDIRLRADFCRRRGLCLREVAALAVGVGVLTAIALPTLAGLKGTSMTDVSLMNLQQIGLAHQFYVQDWNDRQPTLAADGLTSLGATPGAALQAYATANSEPHPGILLGWGLSSNPNQGPGLWGFYFDFGSNSAMIQPYDFASGFGHFRIVGAKVFHDYLNGRYYDELLYAPADTVPFELAAPFFDDFNEYVPEFVVGGSTWSSYCWSPASMVNPAVMRAPSAGGWQDPFTLADGLDSPTNSSVLYPHLKTHIIEHHWNQSPPADCNPAFRDCEPYYFNLGIDSEPATLFYDGSVRLLPNTEVQAADQGMLAMTGGVDGLWSRDTPTGANGYFLEFAFDEIVDVSHHILTTDGVLGRDTLSGVASSFGAPARPKKRRSLRLAELLRDTPVYEEGWVQP